MTCSPDRATLEALVDGASEPMALLGGDGVVRAIAARAVRMLGASRPEIVGARLEAIAEARGFALRVAPLGRDDGAMLAVLTERGGVPAASDEARLVEAIVENIPDMVFVKEAELLSFVRFNRAGEELLGLPRTALLGKTDFDLFPEKDAAFFQAKDRETLDGRVMVEISEEPIETSRGRRLLHTKKVPIVDEHGTPRYLLGISADITERRANDEARSRLAALVEDSEDAIIGRTLDGIVTSWNRSATRIFGYEPDEIVGRPTTVLFPPDRRPEEKELTARVVRGEHVAPYETVRLAKDGREIDVSVALSPVRVDGELVGVSKIVRDITVLKETERQLLRAKEAAEAANEELEAFSYSVAHDLRAPLRSIDGFSQALIEDYADVLDAEGKKYLDFVRKSAQLMAQLIDDMLMLSRVTRAELASVPVDLSAFARATFARLERSDPERKVETAVAEGLSVSGDPRLLAILFDNLLGNAWKFTRKQEHARIEVGAEQGDEGARVFFVRDNGAGFDMAYAGKLFGVFQRLHGANEFEGTGVGLATVQRIVRRHGGRVWAEGEVGRGATFRFTIGEKEHIE